MKISRVNREIDSAQEKESEIASETVRSPMKVTTNGEALQLLAAGHCCLLRSPEQPSLTMFPDQLCVTISSDLPPLDMLQLKRIACPTDFLMVRFKFWDKSQVCDDIKSSISSPVLPLPGFVCLPVRTD